MGTEIKCVRNDYRTALEEYKHSASNVDRVKSVQALNDEILALRNERETIEDERDIAIDDLARLQGAIEHMEQKLLLSRRRAEELSLQHREVNKKLAEATQLYQQLTKRY